MHLIFQDPLSNVGLIVVSYSMYMGCLWHCIPKIAFSNGWCENERIARDAQTMGKRRVNINVIKALNVWARFPLFVIQIWQWQADINRLFSGACPWYIMCTNQHKHPWTCTRRKKKPVGLFSPHFHSHGSMYTYVRVLYFATFICTPFFSLLPPKTYAFVIVYIRRHSWLLFLSFCFSA